MRDAGLRNSSLGTELVVGFVGSAAPVSGAPMIRFCDLLLRVRPETMQHFLSTVSMVDIFQPWFNREGIFKQDELFRDPSVNPAKNVSDKILIILNFLS